MPDISCLNYKSFKSPNCSSTAMIALRTGNNTIAAMGGIFFMAAAYKAYKDKKSSLPVQIYMGSLGLLLTMASTSMIALEFSDTPYLIKSFEVNAEIGFDLCENGFIGLCVYEVGKMPLSLLNSTASKIKAACQFVSPYLPTPITAMATKLSVINTKLQDSISQKTQSATQWFGNRFWKNAKKDSHQNSNNCENQTASLRLKIS